MSQEGGGEERPRKKGTLFLHKVVAGGGTVVSLVTWCSMRYPTGIETAVRYIDTIN